jgi:alcohol dehydrogenase class IV
MDALTHAVEAYTSKKGEPMTDLFAVDAVGRIFKSLPAAFRTAATAPRAPTWPSPPTKRACASPTPR